jgi:predicted LPLAT superfamily acyltransferase
MMESALHRPAAPSQTAGDGAWLTVAERGSVFGMRLLVIICTWLGRGTGRFVLRFVALYFVLVHGFARRSSQAFLSRVEPGVSFANVYRHVLNFAEVALDRIFLMRGRLGFLHAKSNGFDHLRSALAGGRGAMLLGAHLGSFEAMRVLATVKDVPVNVIMYSGNARRVNALLRELNPNVIVRMLEVRPGDFGALLRAKELVDAGEVVALLGDRVGLNDKSVVVDFLGSPARFPTGPYILASALKCPVFLTFGLYTSPNVYECFCEPFAERVELPRDDRGAALASYAARYAARLEHYCRMSPYNWFNFYDFWNVTV